MNGLELFLLGRTLMKIGEQTIPAAGIGPQPTGTRAVLVVLSDVVEHPGSAVGEIAARTGLPQSQVSGCVARLREAGSVVTETDPADRRRSLVRKAPEISDRSARAAAAPVAPAVAAALGTDDPAALAEVLAALDVLSRHLTPESVSRLRDAAASPAPH
ncbi:DNA-binding MarR family transcriptional regulator [Streptomyces sp. TLI_235]|nr:helix-turn-helix domain-containing protein [Streptomyces sp. TLI_235]PBC66100.1 DNA-binding MarR family transcriptional regulator [Streptomyces sp. TLI_235]